MKQIKEIQSFNQKIILIDEFCNQNGWEHFGFRVLSTGGMGGEESPPHQPKIHLFPVPNFYSLSTKSKFSSLINCSRDSLTPVKSFYLLRTSYVSKTIFLTWCLEHFHESDLKQLTFTIDMIKQQHLEFMIKINLYITYLISFSCYRADSCNQLWTCNWHTKYLILMKYLLFEITKNMKLLQRQ